MGMPHVTAARDTHKSSRPPRKSDAISFHALAGRTQSGNALKWSTRISRYFESLKNQASSETHSTSRRHSGFGQRPSMSLLSGQNVSSLRQYQPSYFPETMSPWSRSLRKMY